jgi:tetratricopeptide (TPR) repeat protein
VSHESGVSGFRLFAPSCDWPEFEDVAGSSIKPDSIPARMRYDTGARGFGAGSEKRRMATSIEDLTARAKTLIAERNYHEAVRACRRVLLSQPTLLEVRILLGMALLALRRHDEARAEMIAVLRREPNDATAHRLLGEAYLRDGQTDKAADSLKKAIALAPGDDQAKDLLAEVEDEDRPQLATVDRWFDPEAVATVQSDVPPLFEDDTSIAGRGLPRIVADLRHSPPTVEVDPSLVAPVKFEAHTETVPERIAGARLAAVATEPRPIPRFEVAGVSGELPPIESDQTGAHTPTAKRAPAAAPLSPTHVKSKPSNGGGTDELDLADIEAIEASARQQAPAARPKMVSARPTIRGLESPYTPEAFRDDLPTGSGDPPIFEDDTGEHDLDPVETRARANGEGAGLFAIPELRVVRYEPAPALHPVVPADPFDEDPLESSPTSAVDMNELPPLEGERTSARITGNDPDDELVGESTIARQAPLFPEFERTPAGQTREQRSAPDAPRKSAPARKASPSTIALPGWVPKGPMRWVVLGAVVIVPIAILGVVWIAVAVVDGSAESEIDAAVITADGDGLPGSLLHAIELVEEHDGDDAQDLALRARLLATRVLEYRDSDRAAEASALLAELDDDERKLEDARIASAYLALAEGKVAEARELLLDVETETPSAELAYARGLADSFAGEYDRAAASLRRATAAFPEAARYAALTALVTALAGDATTAARLLDQVPNGAMSPAVRTARARVLFESGRDPSLAVEEANAVLGTLAEQATPVQTAWAHLVIARQAGLTSDTELARREARAAADLTPAGDESFGLALAEAALRANDTELAATVLAALPAETTRADRRARVAAEVALVRGDYDAVARSLEAAGTGAQTAYLRGRVAEARGDLTTAERAYEEAAADPREFVRSRSRLGAIHLRAGSSERAIELLTPAHERAPDDVELVPLLVSALIAAERLDRAEEVASQAVNRRPRSPELKIARARVHLAKGESSQALAALREVARERPDDPEVQLGIAEAAIASSDGEAARNAYERTLELRANDPVALAGLVDLAVDAGDVDRANAAIERARTGGVPNERLETARARLLVERGDGELALSALRGMVRSNESASLYVALGRAAYQAERDREAGDAFTRALEIERGSPWALLGIAEVRLREGSVPRAESNLDAARRNGERRALGPRFMSRVKSLEGRIAFEQGNFGRATERARQAIELDARNADAHLVLANVAMEQGDDPVPHFRAAIAGQAPQPEALGRLALRLRGDEACDLARRYLERAPQGYDAPDVQGALRRCN